MSSFIEGAVRGTIERRRSHSEFIARGLASHEEATRTGEYFSAQEVLGELSDKLAHARAGLEAKGSKKSRL